MGATKPFTIAKQQVMEAFKAVKAKAGAAGIDQQSLADFEKDLKGNLYKIWNRLSSGTYFPPPVKAVAIPKKGGGDRILGVPTVADRVAQMVVKLSFEPTVEPHFLPDSYGYRPGKSALDAIEVRRVRCWRQDWVLKFDIKGLFDNIDHTLLLRTVNKHTQRSWVRLYVERWLKAPAQVGNTIVDRDKGTPQGGVISSLLANLFLHYAFDEWMRRKHKGIAFERYADTRTAPERIDAELTPREFAVFELLARRSPDVVSKASLLDSVWGLDFDGDPNIVEVYVGYLRKKLGKDIVRTVRGAGYQLGVSR